MTPATDHTRAAGEAEAKWRLYWSDPILRMAHRMAADQHRAVSRFWRFIDWLEATCRYDVQHGQRSNTSRTGQRRRAQSSSSGSGNRSTGQSKRGERTDTSGAGSLF